MNFVNNLVSGTILSPKSTSASQQGAELNSIKDLLVSLHASKGNIPSNAQLEQFSKAILSVRPNAQDGSYECRIAVNGQDFVLKQIKGEKVVHLMQPPSNEVMLEHMTIPRLKRAMLEQFLTSSRQDTSFSAPIDLTTFNLSDIDLFGMDFSNTLLNQENLEAVLKSGGDLSGASLAKEVIVKGLLFGGIRMDRTMLATLINLKADLRGIDVSGQDLSKMSLINVDFFGAIFKNANLEGTNLKGAILNGVNLSEARLKGASIDFTDFSESTVTQEQLAECIGENRILDIDQRLHKQPKKLHNESHNESHNVFNPKSEQSGGFDKSNPYKKMGGRNEYPAKSKNVKVEFEGEAKHIGAGTNYAGLIACRHTVAQLIQDFINDAKGKVDFREYSSEHTFVRHVKPESDEASIQIEFNAKENHFVSNYSFGFFLIEQFEKMEKEKVTSRAMQVSSHNHAMFVGLRIVEKKGVKQYVVQFIDPNIGEASPIHTKVTNLYDLQKNNLKSYIVGKGGTESQMARNYDSYFPDGNDPDGNEYAMIYVCDEKTFAPTNPLDEAKNRKLDTLADKEEPTPSHITNLMMGNFGDGLRSLKEGLVAWPQPKIKFLLNGLDNYREMSVLGLALESGCVDSIKAYGELVSLVSDPKDRAVLLNIRISKDNDALKKAKERNYKDAIRAFEQIRKDLLTPEQLNALESGSVLSQMRRRMGAIFG